MVGDIVVLNLLARELLLPIFLVLVVVFEGIWLGPVDEVTRCGVWVVVPFHGCDWIAGWCGNLWLEVRVGTGEDWVHWRNES